MLSMTFGFALAVLTHLVGILALRRIPEPAT